MTQYPKAEMEINLISLKKYATDLNYSLLKYHVTFMHTA